MACCVLMAALLGGAFSFKAWLRFSWRGQGAAQDWRLVNEKDKA